MKRRRRLPQGHLLNVFADNPERKVGLGLTLRLRLDRHGSLNRHHRLARCLHVLLRMLLVELSDRNWAGVLLLRDELLSLVEGVISRRLRLIRVGVAVDSHILLLLNEVVVHVRDGGSTGGERSLIREGRVG